MPTSHLENSDEITFGAEKQLASDAGEAREDNKKEPCIASTLSLYQINMCQKTV